ncbi:MAG: NAD-dependent epimerase/dehydratase family protein [Planctomycetaceae bacterium]
MTCRNLLVTGACGFVGSTLVRALRAARPDIAITGLDNFVRDGSRANVEPLRKLGATIVEGDIRNPAHLEALPQADWVLDCAAEPSVLAGVTGGVSSFDVMDHNLVGTIRVLEYCKRHGAGLILLSTSRVYSIAPLAALPVEVVDGAYRPREFRPDIGLTAAGIDERFPTTPPLSLYGTSKRCSELVALEYADAFGFPVWINRCGVLAGTGQFGKADQGIFTFWIRSWQAGRPLAYIGFDGRGSQVRDCLHPRDLLPVILRQLDGGSPAAAANTDNRVLHDKSLRGRTMTSSPLPLGEAGRRPGEGAGATPTKHPHPGPLPEGEGESASVVANGTAADSLDPRICNFSGGAANAMSLAQLSAWCRERIGPKDIASVAQPRPFDLPWVVLDSGRADRLWGWRAATPIGAVLQEILGQG